MLTELQGGCAKFCCS